MPETGPVVVRVKDLGFAPLGIPDASLAEVAQAIGPEHSSTIGCGFARFAGCRLPWELTYDECIHVLEGTMRVAVRGEELLAGPGDVLFLPRGSKVEYRFEQACTVFFATYPVDWARGSSP